jgi:segregation and condensation protein A
MESHDKVLEILFDKDEITWQTIIYELIKSGEIDPWNVNISLLTQRYIETVKKLEELDFRLSGKVLLAAAILLKIKSNRLMGEDLAHLDSLFSQKEEEAEIFEEPNLNLTEQEKAELIPRVPQPRKRKVSVYDLVNALEQALQVKRRRLMSNIPVTNVDIPKKTRNITAVITEVYNKVKIFFAQNKKNKLTFSQLIPSDSKEDKVYTFIPLLHLDNQRKIDIYQYQHFGEIGVSLRQTEQEIKKELAPVDSAT